MQTVAVSSDTSTLLNAMRAMFSSHERVIGELLQNARRAASPAVEITLEGDTLTFIDAGVGITDFNTLLAIARSGWSEEVRAVENPYGLGFASCLFAADAIEVSSRGTQLSSTTDALIELKPVALMSVPDDGYTRISLIGHRLGSVEDVTKKIARMVEGFPIGVSINGHALPRPHAVGIASLEQTSIGLVSPTALTNDITHCYLQGLPITVPRLNGRYTFSGSAVVLHLDQAKFFGRLPDRSHLLDEEVQIPLIVAGLKDWKRTTLEAFAKTMPADKFIEDYARLAIDVGLNDLINSIPYAPSTWFSVYDVAPGVAKSYESRQSCVLRTAISREVLERDGVYWPDEGLDAEQITPFVLAHVAKVLTTHGDIPTWHWAHALIQNVTPEDVVVVPGEERGRSTVEIDGWRVTTVLVDSLRLAAPNIPALADGFELHAIFDGDAMYVTDAADCYQAVEQVSNFEDDERFDESRRDEAARALQATITMLANNDPSVLLLAFLRQSLPYTIPDSLKARAFKVDFCAEGKVVVSEA